MKIVIPSLGASILIKPTVINVLVVENPRQMYSIAQQLLLNQEGLFDDVLVSSDGEILTFKDQVVVISDPFSIDPLNRKLQNVLFKKLSTTLYSEDLYLKTNQLITDFERLADEALHSIHLPLRLSSEIDAIKLFKAIGLTWAGDNTLFLENLIDYIRSHLEFLNVKLFIMINCLNLLSDQCQECFLQEIRYFQTNVLFLELNECSPCVPSCMTIVDKDMCFVRKNNDAPFSRLC